MVLTSWQTALNAHAVGLIPSANYDALWQDTLLYPSYIAVASILVLLVQAIASPSLSRKEDPVLVEAFSARLRGHVYETGGPIIFAFKLARLVTCIVLVVLSGFSIQQASSGAEITDIVVVQAILFATFIYTSFLATLTVISRPSRDSLATRHLVVVLLTAWGVYVYRDLRPLVTYTLKPEDAEEGWLLWVKISLLTFAAIIVPLAIPRQYIPVDPQNPAKQQHPEQTTPWLSVALFWYLTPLIFKAYKLPHLRIDDLPPMNDRDYTRNLVAGGYSTLDTVHNTKRRHIYFRLLWNVFFFDHAKMAVTLMLKVLASFGAPIGINHLLQYLETGGEDTVVRPWFWVLLLFIGPLLGSVAFNSYFYFASRTSVKAQALLTSLIFDHALRIRIHQDARDGSHPGDRDQSVNRSDIAAASSSLAGDSDRDSQPSPTPSESRTAKNNEQLSKNAANAKSETANFVGKLNNLVSSDASNLQAGQALMMLLFYVPTQLALSLVYLYSLLGWSVFAGVATMLILSPLPAYAVKALSAVQAEKMKKSDARVQGVTEAMNVIRMVKLFGWENKMNSLLDEKRGEELKYIKKIRLFKLTIYIVSALIPCATMIVTYGIYTIIMGQRLTASRVFASVVVFELVQEHFRGIFYLIPDVIRAKVSLDRINDFFNKTELLDQFSGGGITNTTTDASSPEICIRDAAFTWSNDSSNILSSEPSQHRFTLRIEDELIFKRGCINLIIGPTGCGKTSLLMALLGEMHCVPLSDRSTVNLPREGGVAYQAQESWVLNETIRNNILFGAAYDEQRYKAVIEQCALKRDLSLFEAGDQTEVGEKGITLSGGQKARVTLARAVYSPADILLLDDVLAALDVHTARWIVDNCFRGDLMYGRTIILVTHNVALTAPMADFVVSLGSDGRLLSEGSLSSALAKDKKLSVELMKENETIEKAEHEIDPDTTDEEFTVDGKLVVTEEVSMGHVSWSAFTLFLTNLTGSKLGTLAVCCMYLLFFAIARVLNNLEIWIIGAWARQYELRDPDRVPAIFYLGLYVTTILAGVITFSAAAMILILSSLRVSRVVHRMLVGSAFSATLRWLDSTPVSRIITRLTQDIQSIDDAFSMSLLNLTDLTFLIVTKFLAVVIVSPIFLIPGIILIVFGVSLGHVYMQAQLPVKRESSNARAPVVGHFGAAVPGLTSIRAYGAQDMFRKELQSRNDRYTHATRLFWDLNRWIGIQTEALAAIFSASLAGYLIYSGGMDASNTGFSISMAVGFSSMILMWVRMLNIVETEGNSLERVQQYLEIEHEPKPAASGVAPAYWPASGDLRVENLSARYSVDGPKVLHELNFNVKSGERIGIVGRTGSGKSSLTLALLRCILTEGKVYYDGLPIDTLNLDALRSNITIIPQMPELLSGTVRQNVDPLSQYDDAVLNDALRSAGMYSLRAENSAGSITLDTQITGSGDNISVGQRQILALARALVRQSKLLILDEATSAIDYETDTIIQTSLRRELSKDATLLVIAHRLQTIMDVDRIMVLDAGRIAEFDKPSELLKKEDGLLRALVDESGDKDMLMGIAAKPTK